MVAMAAILGRPVGRCKTKSLPILYRANNLRESDGRHSGNARPYPARVSAKLNVRFGHIRPPKRTGRNPPIPDIPSVRLRPRMAVSFYLKQEPSGRRLPISAVMRSGERCSSDRRFRSRSGHKTIGQQLPLRARMGHPAGIIAAAKRTYGGRSRPPIIPLCERGITEF
jgi:hypothetical protein